jgi:hypothetical protein
VSKASLWTFDELREQLHRFEIDYSERMLRYVLASLGVRKLDQVPNESTGKGRVALYHPFAAWVVASAYHSADGSSVRPDSPPLDWFRSMAACVYRTDQPDDRQIELLACYLMVTSPDYGMDLDPQRRIVTTDPDVLDLFPDGRDVALAVLTEYRMEQSARLSREARRPLLPALPYEPPSIEQDRDVFAESTLRWLGHFGWPVVPSFREARQARPPDEGGDEDM